MNASRTVFRYSLWKKTYSLFLFLVACLLPIVGCASEGILWVGILVAMGFFLAFDFYGKKLFCKIVIRQGEVIYEPGGIIWKRIANQEAFPWGLFDYTIFYYVHDSRTYYSSMHISDKKGRPRLSFKGRDITDFRKLVNMIREYNAGCRLVDIEDEVRTGGIIKALSK